MGTDEIWEEMVVATIAEIGGEVNGYDGVEEGVITIVDRDVLAFEPQILVVPRSHSPATTLLAFKPDFPTMP